MSDQSEILKWEQQQEQITKLSEAIRIGSRTSVQLRCKGYVDHKGRTCAYGAAAIGFGAVGWKAIHNKAHELHKTGALSAIAFRHVHGFGIAEANDYRGWTREEIADELEKLGF